MLQMIDSESGLRWPVDSISQADLLGKIVKREQRNHIVSTDFRKETPKECFAVQEIDSRSASLIVFLCLQSHSLVPLRSYAVIVLVHEVIVLSNNNQKDRRSYKMNRGVL